ncbi:MAG: hypothetical protein NW205_08575 [Hyphomicrobiaceae bacterium]|nr:hypothetical protein [Hyphomicrobiaceae bacterium]
MVGCDASDFVCLGLQFIKDNDLIISGLAERLGGYWKDAGGIFGLIATLIGSYGQLIVGLLGGSFGLWKYYRYHDQVMHRRLVEYLARSRKNLGEGRLEVLDGLLRPGPINGVTTSLFIPRQLRRVLRETRWHHPVMAVPVRRGAKSDLLAATQLGARQIEISEQRQIGLREQMASAKLMLAALIASEAERALEPTARRGLNEEILAYLQSALSFETFSGRLEAKEMEAHQLRLMRQYEAADRAYEELGEIAREERDPRKRAVVMARSLRYRAEIRQIQRILDYRAGQFATPGTTVACFMVFNPNQAQPSANEALTHRSALGTMHDWDLLEQAEILFVASTLAGLMEYTNRAAMFRNHANTALVSLQTSYPSLKHWPRERLARLKQEAGKLRSRIRKAENDAAEQRPIDTSWLLPD